jgi:hypothetical protein
MQGFENILKSLTTFLKTLYSTRSSFQIMDVQFKKNKLIYIYLRVFSNALIFITRRKRGGGGRGGAA